MKKTQPRENSRSPATTEFLFVGAGLTCICLLYRSDLMALAPAKWATISAWALMLAGIRISSALDRRFDQMLRRLNNREVIDLSPTDFEQWLTKIHSRAHNAGLIGSIVLPATLLFAYACVYAGDRLNSMPTVDRIGLVVEVTLEMICARIVGRYVGRGISYGFLGKHLVSDGVTLNVIPGHSDNTAGLRPVGDFYFHQATVTALPVLFFAAWVVMMPAWTSLSPQISLEFATQWKNAYLIFLFIALGIEVLAFVLPLWFFHRVMSVQKQGMQNRVDELSATLAKLQREMTTQTRLQNDGEERTQLVEQIALLENLPTWALAPEVRQRFTWGNTAFLSPFAMQISQTVYDAVANGTS